MQTAPYLFYSMVKDIRTTLCYVLITDGFYQSLCIQQELVSTAEYKSKFSPLIEAGDLPVG